MINLGNETVTFKKMGTDFFSIPSLTLSPSSASVQCAAVRTQDGWMRTPPHRNFPLLFCSIIWNRKKRGLTLHGAWLTKYCTHSSLWLQNAQTHQAPKHVTFIEAKALQWDKSTMNKVSVEHLQKSFEYSSWMRAGFIQISMGRCWSLPRSTSVLQSFETQSSNEGIILVSTAHQRQCVISACNSHATV